MRTHTLYSALGIGLLLATACSSEHSDQAAPAEPGVAAVQQAVEVDRQKLMDDLFAVTNQLTVVVKMENFFAINDTDGGPKGDGWYDAVQVDIEGSRAVDFSSTSVQINKKSIYGGSASMEKPAFHLKISDGNNAIGTQHLTFNNAIQDICNGEFDEKSYIRQCLGYRLLEEVGLPHSRCNFANVVWENLAGERQSIGVYVNVEPIKARYLEKNFNNKEGHLYEIAGGDLSDARVDTIEQKYPDQKDGAWDRSDLVWAKDQIQAGTSNYANVVDVDEFIKIWAMEILIKHFDGYTANANNTYLYNNVQALASINGLSDAAKNQAVDFKFIPWGIDQILMPWAAWDLASYTSSNGSGGALAPAAWADPTLRRKLINQVYDYLDNYFTPMKLKGTIGYFIEDEVYAVNSLISQARAINGSNLPALACNGRDELKNQLSAMRHGADIAFSLPPKGVCGYYYGAGDGSCDRRPQTLHRIGMTCQGGFINEQTVNIQDLPSYYSNYSCQNRYREHCIEDGSADAYWMEWCDYEGNRCHKLDSGLYACDPGAKPADTGCKPALLHRSVLGCDGKVWDAETVYDLESPQYASYTNYTCGNRFHEACIDDGTWDGYYSEWCEYRCPVATNPCAGLCSPAAAKAGPNIQSGNLGTGTVCQETKAALSGGNCSEFTGRTLSVNGVTMNCKGWTLPAKRNNGYCIQATAGGNAWASYATW